MRRADRLFQILQYLRVRETTTAAELATEFEVSERTIYRDIQDMMASGIDIEGEAGVGYAMGQGFDLPPLMFTEGEIEALVAGARMVEAAGDDDLARNARSVVAKAQSVLPDLLRHRLQAVSIFVPDFHLPKHLTKNMEPLRRAIVARSKIHFGYETPGGKTSERTVHPLGLFFWGNAWTIICWCELRQDYRSFRPDRMHSLTTLDETYPEVPGRDLETFLAGVRGEST